VDLFKFWFGLPPQALLRLLLPAGLLTLATVLPGRRVARAASFGVALALPFLRPLDTPAPITAAWSALWLLIAWLCCRVERIPDCLPLRMSRPAGVESEWTWSGTTSVLSGVSTAIKGCNVYWMPWPSSLARCHLCTCSWLATEKLLWN